MKQATRKLLQRLMAGQPKPTKRALSEFFVELKKHTIEDLMRMCEEAIEPVDAPKSALLASAKKQLREFGGKASDFLPYLFESASERTTIDVRGLGKSPSLASVVGVVEAALGEQQASEALQTAFQSYAKAHDISYQLKSAKAAPRG